jgi:hypothetical protein
MLHGQDTSHPLVWMLGHLLAPRTPSRPQQALTHQAFSEQGSEHMTPLRK